MPNKRIIIYVSDNTAVSVHNIGQSLLTQFQHIEFQQIFRPFVDNLVKAKTIAEEIDSITANTGNRTVVFSSLVNDEMRQVITDSSGLVFDVYDAFLKQMEGEFSTDSIPTVGRSRRIVDVTSYAIRMNAINYTLAHDDGLMTKDYNQADVIITGLSRTGKTPTCVYLALQFGMCAANYPLTEDDFLFTNNNFSSLLTPYRKKLFGLSINPERLQNIDRTAAIHRLSSVKWK